MAIKSLQIIPKAVTHEVKWIHMKNTLEETPGGVVGR